MTDRNEGRTGLEVAIISMSCRVPGADGVEAFWENLRAGAESVSFFSEEELLAAGVSRETFEAPDYVPAAGVLGEISRFDAAFFGYTPREAELIDPQQRLFLQQCWSAMERAGYDPERPSGPVGVFAGAANSAYQYIVMSSREAAVAGGYQTLLASNKDFLAARVAYKLNLEGPAIGVQTACSTSLTAVHLACQSLLAGECSMALAGGVSVLVPQHTGYRYQPDAIRSRDGHCRAFDESSTGTVSGSGVGVVVLKRLEDALADGDPVEAVIKGSAINNDGAGKVGFTAPRVEGQAAVIRSALTVAEVAPDSIGYVEAHGTGTALGDPIEVKALTRAFRTGTSRVGFCALGSVKTNLGHLDAAAGVVGLIKAALMVRHGELAPSLHFQKPNPKLELPTSPFYVPTECSPWPAAQAPRRAGVSSFGIGGTNVHVVVEEPGEVEPATGEDSSRVVTLSARTASALDAAMERLAAHLGEHPELDLADVAYTLQAGRRPFSHRLAVVGRDVPDTVETLLKRDSPRILSGVAPEGGRAVAFVFPGQGTQHAGMARETYRAEPVFRDAVDDCCEQLRDRVGLDLRRLIAGPNQSGAGDSVSLDETRIAQPALFVVEYALARLWSSLGVEPEALIGHSVGEYLAACLAGVLSLEDALVLVAERGRLMQQCAPGAMLAVAVPPGRAESLLTGEMSLAAHNAPDATVIAGPLPQVEQCEERLRADGVPHTRLATSHAFHSPAMDTVLPEFARCVERVRLAAPRIPYVSNVTGTWIRPSQAVDPVYWTRHLRETVRFADGLETLLEDPARALLEVGPGDALTSLARRRPEVRRDGRLVLSSLPPRRSTASDHDFFLGASARLWVGGVPVDLQRAGDGERPRRVLLPSYPFEGERYWVQAGDVGPPVATDENRRDPAGWLYSPSWRRAHEPAAGVNGDRPRRWAVLVEPGGVGEALVERLRGEGWPTVTVRPAPGFARLGAADFGVDPWNAQDFARLVEDLSADGGVPDRWVHLWGLGTTGGSDVAEEGPSDLGFHSLLGLGRALGERTSGEATVGVVTRGAYEVTGEEGLDPGGATVLGPCRVLPQEYPLLHCRLLDLGPTARSSGAAAEWLMAEMGSSAREPVVSQRGRHRWLPVFEPRTPAAEGTTSRLKQGGVYLITGGLGRVGLALARHLAESFDARLALVGRTGLPERAEWDGVLASGTDPEITRRIRAVRELEEQGGEVLVIPADVADPLAVRAALALTRERLGGLDGIIHAAGAIDSSAVRLASGVGRADCHAQLRPKLQGAQVLAQILGDESLDFVMLTSSLASVLGGLGFSAYATANHSLDCFAHEQHRRGHTEWLSVNWDGWHVGPGEPPAEAISAAEGGVVLERILALPPTPQVVVSTTDLEARLDRWVQLRTVEAEAATAPEARHPRPEMHTVYVPPETPTEKRLVQVWGELLGIESIGVNDNFFELGGSSLLAIQLVGQLKKERDVELSVASLFEAPTVRTLSRALEPDDRGEVTLARSLERGRSRSRSRTRHERRPDADTG